MRDSHGNRCGRGRGCGEVPVQALTGCQRFPARGGGVHDRQEPARLVACLALASSHAGLHRRAKGNRPGFASVPSRRSQADQMGQDRARPEGASRVLKLTLCSRCRPVPGRSMPL